MLKRIQGRFRVWLRNWLFADQIKEIERLSEAFATLHSQDSVIVDWGRKNTTVLVASRVRGREVVRRFEVEMESMSALIDFCRMLKSMAEHSPAQYVFDGPSELPSVLREAVFGKESK